jgi:hypothetical protein
MRQLFVCLLLITPAFAQAPAPASDELMDHLAGAWKMEGTVMRQDAHHDVQAEWVLNHQFLRIQEKTSAQAPSAERPYEATWYLGYDPTSELYVLHLLDIRPAVLRNTWIWNPRRKCDPLHLRVSGWTIPHDFSLDTRTGRLAMANGAEK